MDCETLHKIIRRGKRLDFNSDLSALPLNGVYIMFEKDELAHDGERIVRIGINEGQDRLRERITNHYKGTIRKSIFRKHISSCLDNGTEQDISAYIQSNISFVVIQVNDKVQREELEKRLIATVAQCNDCLPSDMWLGKKCSSAKIAQGKLWNATYLNASPLTADYAQLIYDGLVLESDMSVDFENFLKD